MPKHVLILNSHSLSYFQNCPMQFFYSTVMQIRPKQYNFYIKRGILFAEILKEYYNSVRNGTRKETVLKLLDKIESFKDFDSVSRNKITRKFLGYLKVYKDYDFIPLGEAELGFSEVIFENELVKFIYEGCIDLLATIPNSNRKIVVDHKTTERFDNFYSRFTNQVLGYLWASKADLFCYNYIGFQEEDSKSNFKRVSFTHTPDIIKRWKNDTIKWYWKILLAIQTNNFDRTWNCHNRFKCNFTNICETTHEKIQNEFIQIDFKVEPYKSW